MSGNPFVGTWTLRSTERKNLETGETAPLWGEHPSGTLIYTAQGRMSALVLAEHRKAPAGPAPTEAEALSLLRSMVAYAGRYTIEPTRVIHHVEQSWNQAWTGTDVVRFYKHEGNRLTLTTAPAPNPRDGQMSVSTLVWERLASRFPAGHCGVAENDPRNRGPIAFFAPKQVTPESARETLLRGRPDAPPADIEKRVRQVMARIAAGPVKPPAPISQSLAEVDDPLYGLGTHPDIIERLWALDESLPRSCRWVFWGKPSLVHPETGIVFAVGFGTIGYVMRLPPHILRDAPPDQAKIVARGYDIGPAGPEWRFMGYHAVEVDWCRGAYDFAGTPATL